MADETIFSTLQEGAFDGIVVPVMRVRFRTGSAAAFHRYPYRAGVDIAYTGREPISGSILAGYFNTFFNELAGNVLYPGTLTTLRNRVQEQRSGKLTIPTLGEINAKITLDEDYTAEVVDGAFVTLEFVEDSKDQFVPSSLPSAISRLDAASSAVQDALDRLKLSAEVHMPDLDDGSSLTDFTSGIAALKSSIGNAQDDLGRPLRQATAMITQIDDLLTTVAALRDVSNWSAAADLRDLKATTIEAVNDIAVSQKIKTFVAAADMSIGAVAVATKNSVDEILALNVFEDANSIDRGSAMYVYAR